MKPNLPTGETFSDGSDLPPMDAPEMPAATPEDVVSLTALAMPDEGQQMQTPAVGDVVNYQVTGKITRIEGERAYVSKQTVNGQQVEPDADNASGPPDGDTDDMGQLENAARGMDAAGGY